MDPLHPERDQAARAEGDRRRDAALEQVAGGTPPSWREQAEQALRYVAERREELTTDPVWTVLDAWDVGPPPEPRAMGPVMKAAARSWRWLQPTGRVHRSVRPANHRRPLAVYQSLLYRGPSAWPL